MRKNVMISLGFAAALGALAVACGGGRTTAATQPSPAAFNATGSDPKAIAAVDAMVDKLGGSAAWDNAKQITWDQKYSRDGAMGAFFRHSWDRWNGRHRMEQIDMPTLQEAEREGDPSRVKSLVAMYDLFNQGRGYATYGGQELPSDEKKKRIAASYERWKEDSYKLAFLYKLKDPGVVLKYDQEVVPINDKLCKPNCHIIKVSFSDGVGTDTYFVGINSESSLPELMQKQIGEARLGFGYGGWTDVAGLKLPTKLENLGVAGEIFEFTNIEVGSPDDALYIPAVR
jgi:hypothetical protein